MEQSTEHSEWPMHEPPNGNHCLVRGNRSEPDSMKHTPGVVGYLVFQGVKKRYPLCRNHMDRLKGKPNVYPIQ